MRNHANAALAPPPRPAAEGMQIRARVLRPGGSLHFLEHGRSPDPKVLRWQDRITPLQWRLAGGCHLNRPIDQLLTDAAFHVERLDNYYVKGPKAAGYMYEGVANKA